MMDGFIGVEFTVGLLHDFMGMGQRGGVISQNAIALCTYVEKTKMCSTENLSITARPKLAVRQNPVLVRSEPHIKLVLNIAKF